jgi:hypothetical protein
MAPLKAMRCCGGRLQLLKLAARAEVGQRRAVAFGGISRCVKCEVQDASRGCDRCERAGVHLAEYRGA